MRRDAFGGRAGGRRELSRAGEKSARVGKGLAARFCQSRFPEVLKQSQQTL